MFSNDREVDMNNHDLYNEEYYQSHCGEEYVYNDSWKKFWGNVAEFIIRTINPKRVLDVGCAKGFLVKELRDRGIEAYGIDISEYAISQVDESIKEFCQVGSALDELGSGYDLITCIEVLEHLPIGDARHAIRNICEAADDVLFSSTPYDYKEKTHISVRPVEYWSEEFYYNGFWHDLEYDATYISVQAMRFTKGKKTIEEIIRQYERMYFRNLSELFNVRLLLNDSNKKIEEIESQNPEKISEVESGQERARIKMSNAISNEEKFKSDYFNLEKQYRILEDENEKYKLEIDDLKSEIRKGKKEFEHAVEIIKYNEGEMKRLSELYNQIKNSTCWKITKPLRMWRRS